MGGVRTLLNPRLLAALLQFVLIPPSHWAAALEIERSARGIATAITTALHAAAEEWWRERPLNISLRVAPVWLHWIEPPPLRGPADGGPASLPPLRQLLLCAGECSRMMVHMRCPSQSRPASPTTCAPFPWTYRAWF